MNHYIANTVSGAFDSVVRAVTAIARNHGAAVKVVEVPPGPPVLAPIVAGVCGPDVDLFAIGTFILADTRLNAARTIQYHKNIPAHKPRKTARAIRFP